MMTIDIILVMMMIIGIILMIMKIIRIILMIMISDDDTQQQCRRQGEALLRGTSWNL